MFAYLFVHSSYYVMFHSKSKIKVQNYVVIKLNSTIL